ncbi:MarR family transcriptional regulator [Streptomyces anatolicus]|uniref:MarR family transcriptional regulator n=1 Tax=Streptomyces anatolicus TaxID=2675858 RepID=UPI003FD70830
MADGTRRGNTVERECVDIVEAALLKDRVGEVFDAVVVDVKEREPAVGTVQLTTPAIVARVEGGPTELPLGERLRVSPAAVSGAVRYLTQQHMVSREREPGTRRDLFRVHNNQWYEALGNRDAVLSRWEHALREGVASLGAETPAGRRLAETLAFFEFIQEELAGMMSRWRAHRASLFPSD